MADFIKFSIDSELNEISYPRDKERVSVVSFIKTISSLNGKKVHFLSFFNPFVKLFSVFSRSIRLVFGDCYCEEKVCSKKWIPPFETEQALFKMYKS